ncbi:MAG TPA: Sua5/YciO/YrdC/YwlC family protein, partial [Acidimicrobiales bacterium]|nr:Sua5/YciO/YrdC/YwlC family protein [Acidimicrobiales bacterium]
HDEPIACADCGPRLALEEPGRGGAPSATGDAALLAAAGALREGGIVAVKGLGGYHLAVRADDEVAVARLRSRKRRDDKPFAVMVAAAGDATALVELDDDGLAALASWRRPVVLAPRCADADIAPEVAPGLADLGVVLAYTPMHHLLLREVGRPLVMTSGNLSDEPMAHRDDDARRRLGPLVDALLTHDRPIHVAAEDSVVRAAGRGVQVLRRARGYAPEPLSLPVGGPGSPDVLAVGAERKSTVTVVTGTTSVTGPHLGDLEHPAATAAFEATATHLCRVFAVAPTVVAHDRHPGYRSTQWAGATDLTLEPVLHHHAHAAAGLVEHGRSGPALAVAFAGLGLGEHEALWGGELLDADLVACERVAHLRPVALPGGAAAIREPWRMAVAWVHAACGPKTASALGERLDPRAGALVALLDR